MQHYLSDHLKSMPTKRKLSVYLFLSSPYDLYVMNFPSSSHKAFKIISEYPIQLYEFLQNEQLILIDKNGKSVIYQLLIEKDTISSIKKISQMQIEEGRVIGILQENHTLVLVLDSLEFLWITENQHIYQKQQTKEIMSKYQGIDFMNSSGKITSIKQINDECYVVFQDNKTNLISIFEIKVGQYQVKAGQNCLLNLKKQPIGLYKLKQSVLVHMGTEYVIWGQKVVFKQSPEPFISLVQIDTMRFCACKKNSIWQVRINQQQIMAEKLHDVNIDLLKVAPISGGYICMSQKLEIIMYDQKKMNPLIQNHQASIERAQLISHQFWNILKFIKKIGISEDNMIYTTSRVAINQSHYEHNIMLKMADIIRIEGKGTIYFTNPILGTFKVQLQIKDQIKLSLGKSQGLITNQESVYLDNQYQITYHQIKKGNKLMKVSKLLKQSTDAINLGLIIDQRLLLTVQEQIHIFSIDGFESKFIHCFDAEIKSMFKINEVNLIGCVLWSNPYSLLIYRVTDSQLILMKTIDSNNNTVLLTSHYLSINAVPYMATIFGGILILASNQTLTKYQTDKINIISFNYLSHLNLPSIQACPCLDLSHPDVGSIALFQSDCCFLVSVSAKYLIKEQSELYVNVQPVLGFPHLQNRPLITIMKDNQMVIVSQITMDIIQIKSGALNVNEYDMVKKIWNWDDITYEGNNVIQIDRNFAVLYNQYELWYCKKINKQYIKVSYFSKPNNKFLQFRNNLSVEELTNEEFMINFALKEPIMGVHHLNQTSFLVLYSDQLVILEIGMNQALTIKQQIKYEDNIKVTYVMGHYDQNSLYLKDLSHRLLVLQLNSGSKLYELVVKQNMQEEIVYQSRVKGWKQRIRKVAIKALSQPYQELIMKKDGWLGIGDAIKPFYL